MQNTDVADLHALEMELAKTNIAAIVGERTQTDPLSDPDMKAGIDIAVALVSISRERNELTDECAFLKQQLAASQDRCAQLEATNADVTVQRDYFRLAFKGIKESHEAAMRVLARGHAMVQQEYSERYKQQRASEVLSPKDDGEPIPAFLTDNVTSIKHGRPMKG
jgi:chromosome segregation ATPase